MTGEQKRAVQAVAAKYEAHGVSFISLLELMSRVPKGTSFEAALTAVRYGLSQKYHTDEQFDEAELDRIHAEFAAQAQAQSDGSY